MRRVFICLLIAIFVFTHTICALEYSPQISSEINEKVYCTATVEDDFLDNSIIVVINKENSRKNRHFSVSDFNLSEIKEVKSLTEDISVTGKNSVNSPATAYDHSLTNVDEFRHIVSLEIESKGKQNVLDIIKKIEKLDFVESAEPNYLFYPDEVDGSDVQVDEDYLTADIEMPLSTPDDSHISQQYALTKIQAYDAWQITTGSEAVRVGIIDSGISYHPDLAGNVVTGKDFFNNDYITTDDPSGHGTHIAGIIGAEGDNGRGICGINWKVEMVPLQVVIDDGSPNSGNFHLRAIADAIDYARTNNIPIINCSFGSYRDSYAYIRQMRNYKGLIVCAAGNGKDHDGNAGTPKVPVNTDVESHDPSCCPLDNIISVASTDDMDQLAATSNYGATTVDLAAPGVGILSTYPPTMCGNDTTDRAHIANGYHTKSGTSIAAPHVTGVAALIKSRYPDLTATQIKAAIMEGVTPVAALSGKCVTGGRLNAKGALDKAALFGTRKIVSGDFNGDGKDDVASIIAESGHHTQFAVQLSNGSGFGDQTAWFDNASYAAAGIDQRAVAGDFNGDGKDDLAVLYNYGDGDLKFFTYLSTGSQFSTSLHWYDWSASADYIDNRFVAGDFNGDGKDDVAVMFRYPSGTVNIFTFISNGSSFTRQTWSEWSADMSYVENRFVAGDFNGDGKDDVAVMFRYPSGTVNIFAFISNGSSFTRQTWNEWSADMSYVENRFIAGDFNGDGKDDTAVLFCYPNGTVNLFVFCSNGSSFTRVNWLNWSANVSYIENRFTVGDFDGNAKDDAVVLFQYPSGQSNLFTFMSNGSYFTRENWYQWDA